MVCHYHRYHSCNPCLTTIFSFSFSGILAPPYPPQPFMSLLLIIVSIFFILLLCILSGSLFFAIFKCVDLAIYGHHASFGSSLPVATSAFHIEKARLATALIFTLLTVLALSPLFLLHPIWELHVGEVVSFHRPLILRHCRSYHSMIHSQHCNSGRAMQVQQPILRLAVSFQNSPYVATL